MTLQLYTERQSQKEHCVILLSIQQLISVTTKWKDWPEAETLAYTHSFQLFSRTSSSSGSDCCSVKEVTPQPHHRQRKPCGKVWCPCPFQPLLSASNKEQVTAAGVPTASRHQDGGYILKLEASGEQKAACLTNDVGKSYQLLSKIRLLGIGKKV